MRCLVAVALGMSVATSCPVSAQDRGVAGPSGSAQSADQADIIVTAQRRAERLQDVPISITAVTGDTLTAAGLTRMEDIARIAPGVQMARTGVYNQPAIRGVSTVLSGVGVENPVAIYVDGFYRPFQGGLNFDFTDVAQISILKGPQGTLFGRNATGGAMLVETVKPSLSSTKGSFGMSYARFNDLRVYGNASTPLTRTLAIGLSGYYRRSDGYIKDVAGFDTAPIRNHAFKGILLWEPTGDLRLTGSIEQTRISDGVGLASNFSGHSVVAATLPGTYVESRRNRSSVNHPVANPINFLSPNLKIEYDLGPAKLTSLTQWQRQTNRLSYDLDGSKAFFYDQNLRERDRAFTQELNLSSDTGGRLSYVVGAYYFRSTSRTYDNFIRSYPSTAFAQTNDQFIGVRSFAGFADATYELIDKLFVTGGLRYSWEKRHMQIATPAGVIAADQDRSFESVTPRAVLRYQLAPNSSVYASYSKGFKSGSINVAPPYNAYDPEKLSAYEIGFKSYQHGIRFDTSVYYYDYKNLQVSTLQLIGGSNLQVITNAASSEIYGMDAQLAADLNSRLSVRVSGAYNHARYKDFPVAPVNALNPVTGLNSSSCVNSSPPPATIPCSQDFSGRRMVRAPEWTGNIGADYTVPVADGSIIVAGNLAVTSGYAPNKADIAVSGQGYRYYQSGFALLNLSATWKLPGDHLSIAAFGTNVTDTEYDLVRTGNAFGDYNVQAEPATYGVRVGYHF